MVFCNFFWTMFLNVSIRKFNLEKWKNQILRHKQKERNIWTVNKYVKLRSEFVAPRMAAILWFFRSPEFLPRSFFLIQFWFLTGKLIHYLLILKSKNQKSLKQRKKKKRCAAWSMQNQEPWTHNLIWVLYVKNSNNYNIF